jgi:hypothetical protein
MKLGEKVSYLKGLIDGLEINESTKEGKVIARIADILQDMALEIEDMQDQLDQVEDVVDVIDEDLGEVEKTVFGIDDDECECDDEDDDYDDDDDDEDFDDEDLYEVTCPTCGDTICVNEDMLEEGSINCPNCNELLEFDFDGDDEDDEDNSEE